jgi:hypothetical protein
MVHLEAPRGMKRRTDITIDSTPEVLLESRSVRDSRKREDHPTIAMNQTGE